MSSYSSSPCRITSICKVSSPRRVIMDVLGAPSFWSVSCTYEQVPISSGGLKAFRGNEGSPAANTPAAGLPGSALEH